MSLQEGRISYGPGKGGRRRCPHYYLCNYYPRTLGHDALSSSLLRFKAGLAPDCDTWMVYAREALKAPGAPGGEGFSCDLILRALHHQEVCLTKTPGTSLDVLGADLALRFGARYAPWLVGKRRPTCAFLHIHTKTGRQLELEGVYYWRGKQTAEGWAGKVLILDDIVTTGATVAAILDVVHAALPNAELFVFSLARASPDRWLNVRLMRRDAGGRSPSR